MRARKRRRPSKAHSKRRRPSKAHSKSSETAHRGAALGTEYRQKQTHRKKEQSHVTLGSDWVVKGAGLQVDCVREWCWAADFACC